MTLIAFLLSFVVCLATEPAAVAVASADANAPVVEQPAKDRAPAVEVFTLGDVQIAASNDFGRVKLTTFSNIGPSKRFGTHERHWLAASVFSQVGADVAWNPEFAPGTNGWVILQTGFSWSFKAKNFTLAQSVRVGAIALLPGSVVKPQIGYSAFATAWSGRLNALTIHSLSFDVTGDTSPGYYYEGYVDGGPWASSKKAPRIGVFYENTYGPRVGPRLAIGGFYAHVSLNGSPVYYAGYQFVL